MAHVERRPEIGRTPLAAKMLVGLCLVLFAAIVAYVIYAIIDFQAATDDLLDTDALRAEINRELPPGTTMTEVEDYLDSKGGRYDVKTDSEVDEYFQAVGLVRLERNQVDSAVEAITGVQEPGFLTLARFLFFFDRDERLLRSLVCYEYDCGQP
jgi:hypothetical protein